MSRFTQSISTQPIGVYDPAWMYTVKTRDKSTRGKPRDASPSEQEASRKGTGKAPRGSVLVVDDEAPVRLILRKQLERAGHRVHEAENGAVALKFLTGKSIDVVITDILMPEKDGLETIMSLRTLYPKIKIIAISAPTNQLYLQTAISLGAHAAFPKPFGLAEMEQAVEDLLEPGEQPE